STCSVLNSAAAGGVSSLAVCPSAGAPAADISTRAPSAPFSAPFTGPRLRWSKPGSLIFPIVYRRQGGRGTFGRAPAGRVRMSERGGRSQLHKPSPHLPSTANFRFKPDLTL